MDSVYTVETFPFELIAQAKHVKRKRGNNGGKSKRDLKDLVCAFDIETSNIPNIDQASMYIWQLQVDDLGTIIGRTWDEYRQLLARVCDLLGENESIVFYVHNLSFEFQFLRGIYPFQPDEVFCMDSRKILYCSMFGGKIVYRCSYIHSNMSLAEYTKKMGVEHVKLSGADFDYRETRYPWTPLTDEQIAYCIHDVRGLVEALKKEMEVDGDTLITIPLTSTGYVRRDAKRAMKQVSHTLVPSILPDEKTFVLLREAFRGGNTHANRYYAGRIITDVASADRSSSYPDTQVNCEFPMSRFYYKGEATMKELDRYINVLDKAVVMRVALWGVRLRDPYWGAPYLARDKCRKIIEPTYDNGRILECKYCETTITDVDLRILLDEYDFDNFKAFDVAFARYGKLPRPLVEETISYYRKKTELKNVEGQEIYYMKSKNKLNSIYGMMAQNPAKETILFKNNDYIKDDVPLSERLKEANRRAFLAYQWGCWVTAWARYRLEEGIKLAGDNFVYCDTDCVKYVQKIDWNPYNAKRIKDSIANGAFADDPSGERHYMGVYEQEKTVQRFKTLGAKKYAFEQDGETYITVAGVNKRIGGKELEQYGGLDAFNEGFIFREAGGMESVYNDEPYGYVNIDGHELYVGTNVLLRDSTYSLGITDEYRRILEKCYCMG
jgi:hypothetical protein